MLPTLWTTLSSIWRLSGLTQEDGGDDEEDAALSEWEEEEDEESDDSDGLNGFETLSETFVSSPAAV